MCNFIKTKVFAIILTLITNIFGVAQIKHSINVEKDKINVSKVEKNQFAEFLKIKDSGIFKLINNPCGDDEKIVDASNELCVIRKGISYGSHYSFYSNVHYEKFSHLNYASISFIKGEIVAKNNQKLAQVLTELDTAGLDAVKTTDKEISDLLEFPLKNETELKKLKPIKGKYDFRELQITGNITPKPNRIYALRSVFRDSFNTLKFNGRETVHIFQIVKQENESLLIIWRRIKSTPA